MHSKQYEILNTKISVPARLAQLREWDAKYQEKNRSAQERMIALRAEARAETGKIKRLRIEQKINNYQIITDRLSFMRILVPYTLDTYAAKNLKEIFASLSTQYVDLYKEDKLLWLNNILFLVTPDVRNLAAIFDDMQEAALNHMAYHKLITAPPRNGKTWALNWYAFCYMPEIREEYTFYPIMMVEPLHDDRTKKSLLQQIVMAAGDTYSDETHTQLLLKANSIFSGCFTRLLFIDEIMHLHKVDQRRTVISLSNQGGIGGRLGIVGASVDAQRFWLGDSEIEGRFPNPYKLELYTGSRLNGLLSFIDVLLPFSKSSQLGLRSIEVKKGKKTTTFDGPAHFIEEATQGHLGYIMPLVRRAAEQAVRNGAASISIDLLRNIWGSFPKGSSNK